jgi:circadian clock protein KaiB
MSKKQASQYLLRLYVVGQSSKSAQSISSLKALISQNNLTPDSLEVIDLMKNPQAANQDNVMITPTLVKISPPPQKKIIGDLSDLSTVWEILHNSHK